MLRTSQIDTYDDHRMAMSFSLAALGGVPVRINDPRLRRQDLPGLLRFLEKDPVVSVPVIAIDGPSASGKGTVASRVAERSASTTWKAGRSTGWSR